MTNTESTTVPIARESEVPAGEPHQAVVDHETRKFVLEQYKLFVQSAEATSERRLKANSFYQTLHTALYAAIWAFVVKEFGDLAKPEAGSIPLLLLILPFAILGILCVVWWYNIHSYDQLNDKKFQIVGLLERWLPVHPWRDEWELLEHGENRRVYWPLSRLEKWIPVAMGLCDLGTLIILGWLIRHPIIIG